MSIDSVSVKHRVVQPESCGFPELKFRKMGWLKAAFLGLLLLSPHALAAKDLCLQSNMRAFCEGNLGVSRRDMPQVDDQIRDQYAFEKFRKGYHIECRKIAAHRLVTVQRDVNHDIVINMLRSYNNHAFDPCQRAILVARNQTHYKIMDGHHTSLACRLAGGEQSALIIEEKNNEMLGELQQFKGVFHRGLDDSIIPV